MLRSAKCIVIPHYLFCDSAQPTSIQLARFRDASTKAYAAVVYLKIKTETFVDVKFLAVKTRVAPFGGTTIP